MATPARKITPEEEIFCVNVLTPNVSISEAYARAYNRYGNTNGYGNAAQNLLNQNHIKAKLRERHKKMVEELEITAERIEQEVAKIAFSKVTDVLMWQQGDDGVALEIKASYEIDENAISSIKSIKTNKDGGVEVAFHDKQRALETLGRRFRRFNEVTEVNIVTPEERFAALTPEEKMDRIKELQDRLSKQHG